MEDVDTLCVVDMRVLPVEPGVKVSAVQTVVPYRTQSHVSFPHPHHCLLYGAAGIQVEEFSYAWHTGEYGAAGYT